MSDTFTLERIDIADNAVTSVVVKASRFSTVNKMCVGSSLRVNLDTPKPVSEITAKADVDALISADIQTQLTDLLNQVEATQTSANGKSLTVHCIEAWKDTLS